MLHLSNDTPTRAPASASLLIDRDRIGAGTCSDDAPTGAPASTGLIVGGEVAVGLGDRQRAKSIHLRGLGLKS